MNSDLILNFLIAHKLEASPIVTHFKMELVEKSPYKIYQNKQGMRLIISGTGYNNAVRAVTYLAEADKPRGPASAGWVNTGIAGHKTAGIGSLFFINKIVYKKTGEVYYPALNLVNGMSTGLITVDEPELYYPKDSVYDMEGAGFFKASMNFSSVEFIHSIKVISDNRAHPTQKITRDLIFDLMTRSCPQIQAFCKALMSQVMEFNRIASFGEIDLGLLNGLHFTATQRLQFQRYCQRYCALDRKEELESLGSSNWRSSKDLLNELAKNLE
ncbi:MAG: hypothetical protein P8K27_07025 [Gammaproteobacteria bacterium]|nr:hypothetical protein [Gammaproteobacteria bacterium]